MDPIWASGNFPEEASCRHFGSRWSESGFQSKGGAPCVFCSGVISIGITTVNIQEPMRDWCQRGSRSTQLKKVRAEIPTRCLCATSVSLSQITASAAVWRETPPIADHPKTFRSCMQSKTTWREVPGFWGRNNLRRFRKRCIFSLYPNYLLNDQALPTLGCGLLAERANICFTSPECHSLGALRMRQQ